VANKTKGKIMITNFLVASMTLLFVLNLNAGGSIGGSPCKKQSEQVLDTRPVKIYLPDGSTMAQVGEMKLISHLYKCHSYALENITMQIQLDDEIQPYGIKFKDAVTSIHAEVFLAFDLKQLVNSNSKFGAYRSRMEISYPHERELRAVYNEEGRHQAVWLSPKIDIDNLVWAEIDTNSGQERPLADSLRSFGGSLKLMPNEENGLKKDLLFFFL
jgi:hypothetical protein